MDIKIRVFNLCRVGGCLDLIARFPVQRIDIVLVAPEPDGPEVFCIIIPIISPMGEEKYIGSIITTGPGKYLVAAR